MKLGIMQPYFLPYLGYWQLLNAVDTYVVYDDVNYIKGGWIPRNRILVHGEVQFIRLKLSQASSYKRICDTELSVDPFWRDKLLKTIYMAYHKAPYFDDVYAVMQKIISYPEQNLANFLVNSLFEIRNYLRIDTRLIRSSQMMRNECLKGEERVIHICKQLGAKEYYNAIGGKALYNGMIFREKGIDLHFLRTNYKKYPQFKQNFVAGLSILDIMMFNPVKKIGSMLQEYTLEKGLF